MGVFADYTGTMHIEEEKRKLFAGQMEKILYYGGMMSFDIIKMFGYEQGLLVPFKADQQKTADFHYNYFEDDAWEPAGFHAGDGEFWSGKIGSGEFCDVITAAYMLYELYDENPGFVEVEGITSSSYVVGWLNHLLKTDFSMKKHFQLWKNAESYMLRRMEDGYGAKLSYRELMDMIPGNMRYAACGTEFADLMYIIHGTGTLDMGEITPDSYPGDILRCRNAVREFLDGYDGDDALDQLWMLVTSDYDTRKRIANGEEPDTGKISEVAALSLLLPAHILAYLAAEYRELEFWKTWKGLAENAYHDEKMKKYAPDELLEERRHTIEAPIEPVRTSDYLRQDGWFTFYNNPEELKGKPNYYLSDDDRLYWWSESSDEVILSDQMDRWLKGLAARHTKILESIRETKRNARESRQSEETDAADGKSESVSFLEDFLTLLEEIETYYKHIYPFQNMFYEFVQNGGREEYCAAVELLGQLAEENREEGKIIEKLRSSWDHTSKNVTCNIGRLRLKRYLSVMANPELRKKYFGF